jgi:PTS system nitrogen regulatory IIA component
MKLGINETAQTLSLPLETLDRWIRQGRIPIQKQGNLCVFNRSTLERWAAQHKLKLSLQEDTSLVSQTFKPENLLTVMQRGGIVYEIDGGDVRSVLTAAISRMPFVQTDTKEKLVRRLIAREELSSTGIGKGVAIPHPRTPLTDAINMATITTCFLKNPVEFDAVDDLPVFVMFLILSPSVKLHLHLLSRLAYCLRSDPFADFLKTTPEAKELFTKIAEFEAQLESRDNL